MDLEANISMSLLGHPAEVNWLFPDRQGEVDRRCWNEFRQKNQIHDLIQFGHFYAIIHDYKENGKLAFYLRPVWWRPPSWWALRPQQQCAPSGRSGSGCDGPSSLRWCGRLWDRLLSLPAWGCHHSPQLTTAQPATTTQQHSITTWSLMHRSGWRDWLIRRLWFDIFQVLLI